MINIVMDISASDIILRVRRKAGLTQRELAARAGTSQPAIARIESGLASPTFDTLTRLVVAAGFDLQVTLVPRSPPDPVVDRYKRDLDRTLLRENLSRSVEERIQTLVELQDFAAEALRAGEQAGRKR
jgi:transcriptional regulator with XRE-family HTH domain